MKIRRKVLNKTLLLNKMEYKTRGKNRNLKRKIEKLFSIIEFKSLNLDIFTKIVLVGNSVTLISLFLSWVLDSKNTLSWNSFNSISGNIGYISIIILFLNLFIIFSGELKNNIKLHSNIKFKDYSIFISTGVFIILSSVIIISFISSLQIFSENIEYSSGIILYLCGGLFTLIGGILMRNSYKKNNIEMIINESEEGNENNTPKNNMKLPF